MDIIAKIQLNTLLKFIAKKSVEIAVLVYFGLSVLLIANSLY